MCRRIRFATKKDADMLIFQKDFVIIAKGKQSITFKDVLFGRFASNVFIDGISSQPICIDCVVKFVK